jgi:ElaB/YqjD/DUF883 family membrane-anchored ribosome-binding protein
MRENTTFEPGRHPSHSFEGLEETTGAHDKGFNRSTFKEKARPMLSRRKGELVDRIKDTVEILRETGDTLIERDKARGGEYAHKAAARLDQYSAYLQENSVDRIIDDVQKFGRERPWITIGGAFFVGVAVARFLKASDRS